MHVDVRRLGPGDDAAVIAAGALFDDPPKADATAQFLADPRHHLLIAYDDAGRPIGFVSGVEVTHPDKGTEMFLYELSVEERFRRRGVGRTLVEALDALGRERGCHGMWVITDTDNEAARATYAAAGGKTSPPQVMIDWEYS
jgi:ribosomal protein S18 acetylase RimI-like enzyme